MSAIAPVGKPAASEYAPYYEKYISLVDGEVLSVLKSQQASTISLLRGISEERSDYKYAEGKWSIKELVGHVCDSERIFGYRALRFARNDQTDLPGFDQDTFVANSNHSRLRLRDIADEFDDVRRSTLSMFRNLDPSAWGRQGAANKNEVTVRALACIIAGHERHHVEILKARYL